MKTNHFGSTENYNTSGPNSIEYTRKSSPRFRSLALRCSNIVIQHHMISSQTLEQHPLVYNTLDAALSEILYSKRLAYWRA